MSESSNLQGELERIGAQFPVLAQRVHDVPLAYLDNAATTQMPQSVLTAMNGFEQHDRANILLSATNFPVGSNHKYNALNNSQFPNVC